MMHTRRALPVTAVLVLALAACGSADESAAPTSSAPAVTATATPTASATADADATDHLPWDDSTEGGAAPDSALTATGLSTETPEGYDRVVLELSGTGAPGWLATRSATAVENPSGDPLDLSADGYLAVVVTGLTQPENEDALNAGTTGDAGTVVTGTEFTGVFEGEAQLWLGLSDPQAPYRIHVLSNPTRLVVDVQHAMA